MSSSPDIIKDASDALRPISDRGITVMQGWYDKDIHDRHVTLWDLGENDENFSDDTARLSPCLHRPASSCSSILSFDTCLPYKCGKDRNTARSEQEINSFVSLTVLYAVFTLPLHFLNTCRK